eukprot:TRINITY_DN15013_c0_g1_i3.p1 TRINITY_DN15013_c0_g1~~TRINITY_DN15013_c0_g1_i3.p1  ORF type:complete len:295 (-),score=32.54 TRINITY_DN15013_c0_g1_i3:103-987(-)
MQRSQCELSVWPVMMAVSAREVLPVVQTNTNAEGPDDATLLSKQVPGHCDVRRLKFSFWFASDTGLWQKAFLQSPFLGSAWLRNVRVANALILFGIWVWSLECQWRGVCRWWQFLTNWTLTVNVAYLVCAALMMILTDPSTHKAPVIVKAVWALQAVALPGSLVVALLFWGLLAPDMNYIEPVEYFVHGYNAIAMVFDFVLVRQPYYSLHTLYYVAFGTAYVMFTGAIFVAYGCLQDKNCDVNGQGDPFVYPVFNWQEPRGAVITGILAFAAAAIVGQACFAVSYFRGANMDFM